MIIERCDRCGREKHIKLAYGLNTLGDERKEAPISLVKYSITRYFNGDGTMLHLCENCTKDMERFMDELEGQRRERLMKKQEAQE